jgi:hypothetical protein
VDQQQLYTSLSATIRTYRLQEEDSPRMANSIRWANDTISYFEQNLDSPHVVESSFQLAAIFLAAAQLNHTDISEFRRIAADGDRAMAHIISNVGEKQKAHAYRLWGRFYYNLARPKSGRLSEDWDARLFRTIVQQT